MATVSRRRSRPLTHPPRWRWLVTGLALTTAADGVIWFGDAGLQRDRVLATVVLAGLAGAGLLLWLTMASGLDRGTRVAIAGATVGTSVILAVGLQVRGLTLDGVPLVEPRSREPGADLPTLHADPWSDVRAAPPPTEPLALALDWAGQAPRRRWRADMGAGAAGFATDGRRVITQEQRGRLECVVAYDARTGEELWAHGDTARFAGLRAGLGPRATPLLDAGRVWALGATGVLRCLDAASGARLWQRRLVARPPTWGAWAPPRKLDARLFVSGGPGQPLLALDAETGDELWRVRTDTGTGAPAVLSLAGTRQIVTFGPAGAAGHDPDTGARLWRWPWMAGAVVDALTLQPAALGPDRVLLGGGRAGLRALEISAHQGGGGVVAALAWRAPRLRPRLSTPVIVANHVYGLDDGTLVCLEAATGHLRWRGRRYGPGHLLAADSVVLVLAEDGTLAAVAADPTGFHETGRVVGVPGPRVWAPPLRRGDRLWLRGDGEAACWQLPVRRSAAGVLRPAAANATPRG